jgi:phenylpyruvate tautomerase
MVLSSDGKTTKKREDAMPLVNIHTNVSLTDALKDEVLVAASKLMAELTHKPEKYVMAVFEPAGVRMAGQPGPAAFVDVRGIGGLTPDVNRQISKKVCELLQKSAGVSPDRVYINFTDVDAANWGWNGSTFG